MIEYVAGFLFENDFSKVALVRKKRPAWQAGRLNAIGGHVENGEALKRAMQREFREETGLVVHDWTGFCMLRGTSAEREDWRVSFWTGVTNHLATRVKMARPQEDETIEVVDTFPHTGDRLPNLRWLIPMAIARHEGLDRADLFNITEQYR